MRGIVDWLRTRPRWLQLALLVLAAFTAMSIYNGVPRGVPYVSGTLAFGLDDGGGGGMHLTNGRNEAGIVHLEYQGDGADGVIIDGMDLAGTRGTITLFGPTIRTYADVADCPDAGITQDPAGRIMGVLSCPQAHTTGSGGGRTQISVRFDAAPAPAASSGS